MPARLMVRHGTMIYKRNSEAPWIKKSWLSSVEPKFAFLIHGEECLLWQLLVASNAAFFADAAPHKAAPLTSAVLQHPVGRRHEDRLWSKNEPATAGAHCGETWSRC